MTTTPDDIPASVTKLMDTAPPAAIPWGGMTRDQCASLIAHFWPAIEQHIREQVAQELLAVDPVDWALAGQHAGRDAAAIARGTNTTRSQP